MMRKMLAVGLCICACLLPCLVGCHSVKQPSAFELPKTFDTDREFELTFWAKNDTNITQQNIYKKAIADFRELYPNIHITLKPYTDYSRIYSDVITNIQTGTTPNICITYPDHVATYNSGGEQVVNLDNLLTDKTYGLGGKAIGFKAPTRDEVIPEFLRECYLGESCYALPFMRSTEACYVNVDLVKRLGYELPEKLTWDFIWEVSEAAMKKDKDGNFLVNGSKTMIPFIYKSTDNMMIQMLKQKGAEYSDENGNILIFNDETKDILYTVAEHADSRAFSTFKISSYPGNYLNAGECIFAIDSTAGATWMGTNSPNRDIAEEDIKDFNVEVMEIPQFDVNDPKMISQGPSVCLFNKEDPQEVLASWLFMQYLLSDGVQIAYAQTEGYVPVTKTAQSNPQYLDYLSRAGEDNELYYDIKIKATKLLLENTENTFITPVFNGSASLRNAAGQLIEEVTKRERRRKTVDDEYIEGELYPEMIAQYKLKAVSPGALPAEAVITLSVIAVTWVAIGVYWLVGVVKKKKLQKNFNCS